MEVLNKFPLLNNAPSLKIVITGNRPDPSQFKNYPSFIWFDGILSANYTEEALNKIVLFSDNLQDYITWNGSRQLDENESQVLTKAINKAHQLSKPVRFWNAPDNYLSWNQLMLLKVDFINTDRIHLLAEYLKKE